MFYSFRGGFMVFNRTRSSLSLGRAVLGGEVAFLFFVLIWMLHRGYIRVSGGTPFGIYTFIDERVPGDKSFNPLLITTGWRYSIFITFGFSSNLYST